MIGSGLKKLAKENNMKVYGGVAYGSLRGFAATLSEGAGFKRIDFAVSFPDAADRVALTDRLTLGNVRSTYRVQNISFSPKSVQVVFHDTVGTMKKIREFLEYFLPLLQEYNATTANICAECGGALTAPKWVQVNGICYPLHDTCAQRLQLDLEADNAQRLEEDPGNYLTGTLGALGGAILGGLVWGLVLKAGYMASLVGLFIGWLAEVGYRIAKGKQGKGKTWILAAAIVLAVTLGTFVPELLEIGAMIAGGQLPGFHMGELPVFIVALLVDNAAYRSAVLYNLGMGLLFAGLGVFVVLQRSARDVAGCRFRYMK